jgi:hypothetical protein
MVSQSKACHTHSLSLSSPSLTYPHLPPSNIFCANAFTVLYVVSRSSDRGLSCGRGRDHGASFLANLPQIERKMAEKKFTKRAKNRMSLPLKTMSPSGK